MKKAIILLVLSIFLVAVSAPAMAGPGGHEAPGAGAIRHGAEYVPGEILVKLKAGAGSGAAGSLRARVGALSSERRPYTDFDLLKVPSDRLEEALASLRSSGLVEYAEPNYIRHADYVPTDPLYPKQWNFNDPTVKDADIEMEPAWDVTKGNPGVVVAVLDTGIAYRNGGGYNQAPDFNETSFVQGYDFVNGDQYADDDDRHGTHVAGTIAQSTSNDYLGSPYGVAGVAFQCTLMPVKVLNEEGSGSDSDIIQGIRFAADRGVEVINMSLSGPEPNEALRDAIDYAFGKNVVVCASSGNNDTEFVDYPAAYPNCIAVGATNRNAVKASYSNYGSALDVVAPGGDGSLPASGIIQQTYNTKGEPSSGFGFISLKGTSMACPHVAGVAALVKSKNPTWSAVEVRGAVSLSCVDLGEAGWDRETGWGLIDALAAVTQPRPSSAGPDVSGINPDHAASGGSITVTATGSNITNPSKMVLERIGEEGIGGTGVTQTGSTRIRCAFSLAGAQAGLWGLVVEDKAMRSDTVQGGFMVDSADNRTWYLAEGSTNYGFEEFVLLQNPGAATANAQLTFMTLDGPMAPYPVSVPPQSRATVRVNDVVNGQDISTRITSDQDIICERSMYWNGRIEGTDSIGVQAPSYAWYLAEGTTSYGFDTFLLIQNPTARATTVEVTYLTSTGPVEKEPFTIDANSRFSINVRDDLPASDMSFEVVADQRVICERSMYWDGRRGGHDSIGTNSPAQEWYLAEGSTGWGFDEYVLLGNPGAEAASVDLTYMTPSGPVPQGTLSIASGSRVTVRVNDALPGEDVSVKVMADRGIVAERAMYWNNGTGKAGHCALGVPQPRQECFLAEGSTDWGFDEWVLIQNPNGSACSVGIDYMTSRGLIPTTGFSIPANSRVSVHVNDAVPGLDTSTKVYSNLPIIAERSMYWNGRGGGHVSPGLMK